MKYKIFFKKGFVFVCVKKVLELSSLGGLCMFGVDDLLVVEFKVEFSE